MTIQTGSFEALGQDYESGTNAALLAAIARSAEVLTSGKGWPEGVDDLLAMLGKTTGVSRVWIFQLIELTDTHITQDYTFEWADSHKHKQIGMPMFSMHTNKLDVPDYYDLIESRKRGEWQKAVISQLEPGWLRDNLEVQRIKTMLTIPIMVEGRWWGTLGFDDCEREYNWSDVEIALLRTAGYLISNAVLHDQLSAKRRQFEIFRQMTDSNVWRLDLRRGRLWCSSDILHSVPVPSENLRFSMLEMMRLFHPEDRRELLQAAKEYLKNRRQDVFRRDLRVLTDCGGVRWVELIGNATYDTKGRPIQFAGIAVDIRQRKREEERLRTEAVTDPLTGVMNRREFERELSRRLVEACPECNTLSLMLLDVDYFKDFNDKHGHLAGDAALKHFTRSCASVLRKGDYLARIGGDEFAVLLPETDAVTARTIGERIRQSVERGSFTFGDAAIPMTTSIGCVAHKGGLTSTAKLIARADHALYAAKQHGRNRLVMEGDVGCANPK